MQSKNAHSYCENLKQKSINELATEKLTIINSYEGEKSYLMLGKF